MSRSVPLPVLSTGVLALAGLLVLVLGATAARAQPAPAPAPAPNPAPAPPPGTAGSVGASPTASRPDTAADAATRLQQVQDEAEALTDQWHAAQDDLAARRAELEPLRAAVAPALAAVDAAQADQERYHRQVDEVVLTTFESGNLDGFNALLASGSPQDYLDQMSALEIVGVEHRAALDRLGAVVEQTARARSEADAAVARSEAAAEQAALAEQDITVRKRDAEMRIDAAERLLETLTPQQRRDRIGPVEGAPSEPVVGDGAGVQALRAARRQLGKPYRWGGNGPGSFDCSGLTSWAFKQAGITLPRASRSQATVGRPVSWDAMRPGDLVFFHSPVSHVGIYAGDGKMINAPQTGDVVRYATVSTRAFSGARRL